MKKANEADLFRGFHTRTESYEQMKQTLSEQLRHKISCFPRIDLSREIKDTLLKGCEEVDIKSLNRLCYLVEARNQ